MAIYHLGRNTFGDPADAGKLMTLEEAHQLLTEWVPNERLQLHMKQVGGCDESLGAGAGRG
jgi:predicted hydrolase (HD superfamily)